METRNNQSVHDGTNVILTSGNSKVTVFDVESAPGIVTVEEGELVLAETVIASIQLGRDGVTSGGIEVDFHCDIPTTTTTTATAVLPSVSATTVAPTTVPQVEVLPQIEIAPSQPAPPVVVQPSFTG